MTQPTPLDRAVAPPPTRRLLGPLTGVLPRRGGRPAPGHPAEPAGSDRPSGVREDDALWWEVVRGAPIGSLTATVPAPTSAAPLVPGTPTGPAVPASATGSAVSGAVPVERPSLARAEGWLHARAGAVAAAPLAPPSPAPAAAAVPPVVAAPWVAPLPGPAAAAATDPSPSATLPHPPTPVRRGPRHLAPPVPSAPGDTVTAPELVLDDGRRVALTTTLLLGRNPAPRAGEAVGALVAVEDTARSVSKTHLAVGLDAAGVWVVDRRSTNGTVVTLPDGQQILAVPERRVRLVSGAAVRFGDHGFTLVAGGDRS